MAMKTNIVAPVGGILILIGGLALAFYTGTDGQALVEARAKAVEKYIGLTEQALAKGEMKMAEKYAKEALVVDPKNKKGIAEFKKVILASCPKTASAPAAATATAKSETAEPSSAAPAAQPAQPKAEAEEEMGCI